MRYLSVCSGIEAATVAWHPLGWQAVAYSEIEAFPSALLAHYYPETPNHGDMIRFKEWPDANVDVLVGGTPCQAFSVAGLRKGLADPRGNLTLTYLAIAARYRPAWLVWENVPGVFSDGTGAFGAFVGGLAELGYGFAYRVMDAQFFGVAQRRRRVFVVGYFGDWRRAAAVLFERESLSGNPAPRRETGQRVAPTVEARANAGGAGWGTDFLAGGGLAHSLKADGFDASEDGTGRGTPLVPELCGTLSDGAHNGGGLNGQDAYSGRILPVAIPMQSVQAVREKKQNGIGIGRAGDEMFTLTGRDQHAVAFTQNQRDEVRMMDVAGALPAEAGMKQTSYVAFADLADPVAANQARTYTREGTGNFRMSNVAIATMQVRRLTPRECERLQGFPDDYTLIPYNRKPAKDGPRYKALGNSMAVPVMRWIGQRIELVEALCQPHNRGGD